MTGQCVLECQKLKYLADQDAVIGDDRRLLLGANMRVDDQNRSETVLEYDQHLTLRPYGY